jgi:hypothetical protein
MGSGLSQARCGCVAKVHFPGAEPSSYADRRTSRFSFPCRILVSASMTQAGTGNCNTWRTATWRVLPQQIYSENTGFYTKKKLIVLCCAHEYFHAGTFRAMGGGAGHRAGCRSEGTVHVAGGRACGGTFGCSSQAAGGRAQGPEHVLGRHPSPVRSKNSVCASLRLRLSQGVANSMCHSPRTRGRAISGHVPGRGTGAATKPLTKP